MSSWFFLSLFFINQRYTKMRISSNLSFFCLIFKFCAKIPIFFAKIPPFSTLFFNLLCENPRFPHNFSIFRKISLFSAQKFKICAKREKLFFSAFLIENFKRKIILICMFLYVFSIKKVQIC